jgi:hypothetical protein
LKYEWVVMIGIVGTGCRTWWENGQILRIVGIRVENRFRYSSSSLSLDCSVADWAKCAKSNRLTGLIEDKGLKSWSDNGDESIVGDGLGLLGVSGGVNGRLGEEELETVALSGHWLWSNAILEMKTINIIWRSIWFGIFILKDRTREDDRN